MNFIVQCLFVWVFICKVTLQIVFYFKLATITENSVTFLSHVGEESSPCCPGISKKTVSIFWRLRNSNIVCLQRKEISYKPREFQRTFSFFKLKMWTPKLTLFTDFYHRCSDSVLQTLWAEQILEGKILCIVSTSQHPGCLSSR